MFKSKKEPVKSAVILSFPLASGALCAYLSFDSGKKQLWACVGKGVVILVKELRSDWLPFPRAKERNAQLLGGPFK